MRVACVAVVVALLVASACALYAPNSDVVLVTKDNFAQKLKQNPGVWMVEFFAPWCGHCKTLAPHWEKAATQLKGLVNVAAVDCDDQRDLCGAFSVQGFPTVKSWDGTSFDKSGAPKLSDYQGARESGAIVAYALDQVKSSVVEAKDADKFAAAIADLSVPKALFFTDKAKATPLAKALSMQFAKRLDVILVNGAKLPEIAAKYEVTAYPAIVVLKADAEPVRFPDQKVTPVRLQAFLAEHAIPLAGAEPSKVKKEAPKPKTAVLHYVTTQAAFDELCAGKAAGVCVISALNPQDEAYAAQLQSLQEAANENARAKAHYFVLDGLVQTRVITHLQMSGGFPAMIIYSPTSQSFAWFTGHWSTPSLSAWLKQTFAGSVKLRGLGPLPPLVVPAAPAAAAGTDAADAKAEKKHDEL